MKVGAASCRRAKSSTASLAAKMWSPIERNGKCIFPNRIDLLRTGVGRWVIDDAQAQAAAVPQRSAIVGGTLSTYRGYACAEIGVS